MRSDQKPSLRCLNAPQSLAAGSTAAYDAPWTYSRPGDGRGEEGEGRKGERGSGIRDFGGMNAPVWSHTVIEPSFILAYKRTII